MPSRGISDADLSLADAIAIAEYAHNRLLHDIRRLGQATIHSSPCNHDERDHHAATAHHFPDRAAAAPPIRAMVRCVVDDPEISRLVPPNIGTCPVSGCA